MKKLIALVPLLLLLSCERAQRYTEPPSDTKSKWTYDEFIKSTVSSMPELLTLSDKRMLGFCPKWPKMLPEDRVMFWADLLFSMAGPESTWEPTAMFWEKSMGIDKATNLPIVSEGLLQLSYQDKLWYKDCRFDIKGEEEKFKKDWQNRSGRTSWKSIYPERSTLIPENNLHCGLVIYKKLLTNPKYSNKSFADIGGMYWAVMRTHKSAHKQVIGNMKSRGSKCF